MIYIKKQRILSSASTRFFWAVSDVILSIDSASIVDFVCHHCGNDVWIKNFSNEPDADAN
jgi:hypothetical protein